MAGKKGKGPAAGQFVDRLGSIGYNEPAFCISKERGAGRARAAGGKELRDGADGSEEEKARSPSVLVGQTAAGYALGLFSGCDLL